MWGEPAPPTAFQERLCHGAGVWLAFGGLLWVGFGIGGPGGPPSAAGRGGGGFGGLRSELGGAAAQVGEPLVAGEQLPGLVGGLPVVEDLQQRPGEQLPLAQGQIAR